MTSDYVEIKKWDPDADEYQLAVTYYPDGTVEGDDMFGSRLETLVQGIQNDGEDPADYFPRIAAALVTNWTNAVYNVDVILNGERRY